MLRRLFCLLITCAGPVLAQVSVPDNPTLEVAVTQITSDGHTLYQVDASATVHTPLAAAWKILTDYERMSEFVPELASAKILSRAGNQIVIEQFGAARFLFIAKPIHLIVRATETPMSAIDIALISGNMQHYEARWELRPALSGPNPAGSVRIIYRGRLMPDFYVPGLFGVSMVRHDIRRMMQAVLARLAGGREQTDN
ncbi:MAG: ribosome-associated toxin RatA of RatAB toxin-antitoxin module [Janthinobacterium sp.]|jgi:ribosome-associated toxin RatA of RatAB toxin-antitoxin module